VASRQGADPVTIVPGIRRAARAKKGNGTRLRTRNAQRADPHLPAIDMPWADLYNARRFVTEHGDTVRYVPQTGLWLTWDGRVWQADLTGEAERLAKATVDGFGADLAAMTDPEERETFYRHWRTSSQVTRIRAMLELARTEPGIPVLVDQLDADDAALACLNGVIDLRTGRLCPHDRNGPIITKLVHADYRPDAQAPGWQAFLQRIFDDDQDLIEFVQRAAGYAATGSTAEHVLIICWGAGANGKSTLLGVLTDLGEHALTAPAGLLLTQAHEQHPTRLASLHGRRMVVSYELEAHSRLNEGLVKQLTGDDPITARYMRQDFFEFRPRHKLWLATNHKPHISGTDHAIGRRIRLVPFAVTIPESEQVRDLKERLLATEAEGILAWLVEGAIAWYRDGLGHTDAVDAATDAYRGEEDTLAQFLDERCQKAPGSRVRAVDLARVWRAWCAEHRVRPGRDQDLVARLIDHGFDSVEEHRSRWWLDVGLLDEEHVE
jgi:putative DNA primase/helicase